MAYEIATALVLISIPALLSYFVINLREEIKELMPLRIVFFCISIFALSLITQYGIVLAQDNGASANIITLLTTPLYVLVPLGVISVVYVMILVLIVAFKAWQFRKEQNQKSIFSRDD